MTLDEPKGDHSPSSLVSEPLAIVQLRDLLDAYNGDEGVLRAELAKFSCSRNLDVQTFLHQTALQFEKTHKSRTYLAVSESSLASASTDLDVMGYFTLSLKHLTLGDGISRTKQKELNGLSVPQGNVVVGYLIGQLGKNDTYGTDPIGDQLLDAAIGILEDQAQRIVGGRFVIIECSPHPKLLEFYQRNGFSLLQVDSEDGMAQLICRLS